MFGINYRYELNPEKGTIKLAPTRKMILFGIAPYIVIPAGLFLAGLFIKDEEVPEDTFQTEDLNTD